MKYEIDIRTAIKCMTERGYITQNDFTLYRT